MKVLLDECTPKALKTSLSKHGHECRTVQEAGWSGKQNGELLSYAEASFDVFVTVDANLPYQQNIVGKKIAVVILAARTNRLVDLSPLFSGCAKLIEKILPGETVSITDPNQISAS